MYFVKNLPTLMENRRRKPKTGKVGWLKSDLTGLIKNLSTQMEKKREKSNNQLDKKSPNPNGKQEKKTKQFWNKIQMI